MALLHISGSRHGWVLGALAAVLIASGVQMGLQARRGLTVTDDGIDVQNTWRRHRVGWDEARRFDVVWRYAYNSRWLRIELVDGTKLWSPGFHARTEGQRETVDGRVAELNRRAASDLSIASPG